MSRRIIYQEEIHMKNQQERQQAIYQFSTDLCTQFPTEETWEQGISKLGGIPYLSNIILNMEDLSDFFDALPTSIQKTALAKKLSTLGFAISEVEIEDSRVLEGLQYLMRHREDEATTMNFCFILQYYHRINKPLLELIDNLAEEMREEIATVLTSLPVLPDCLSWIKSQLSENTLSDAAAAQPSLDASELDCPFDASFAREDHTGEVRIEVQNLHTGGVLTIITSNGETKPNPCLLFSGDSFTKEAATPKEESAAAFSG